MDPDTGGNPCSIDGQQDIYGMGIRAGLYLQWYSTVLAYLYASKEASALLIINILFSMATAIALLVHRQDIDILEVKIVTILLLFPPLLLCVRLLDCKLFLDKENKGTVQQVELMETSQGQFQSL